MIPFKLSDILNLPFLRDVKFWAALFNTIVIFSLRLNFHFTIEEIAAVNLVITVIFGIAPPTITYLAQVRELRAMNQKELSDESK